MAYPTPDELKGWALTCVGAAGAALVFWRKYSKTSASVKRDDVEASGVQFVFAEMKERNEALALERDKYQRDAREAWSHRTADAELIAKLRAENEALRQSLADVTGRLDRTEARIRSLQQILRQVMPEEARKLLPSDFGGLSNS